MAKQPSSGPETLPTAGKLTFMSVFPSPLPPQVPCLPHSASPFPCGTAPARLYCPGQIYHRIRSCWTGCLVLCHSASSPRYGKLGFSQGGNDLLGSCDLNMKGHVTQSCRSHIPWRWRGRWLSNVGSHDLVWDITWLELGRHSQHLGVGPPPLPLRRVCTMCMYNRWVDS